VLAGDFPLFLVLSSGSLPLHLWCGGLAVCHLSWALGFSGVELGVGCPGSFGSFGSLAGVFLTWGAQGIFAESLFSNHSIQSDR
jgi:hypothetical protein